MKRFEAWNETIFFIIEEDGVEHQFELETLEDFFTTVSVVDIFNQILNMARRCRTSREEE